MNDNNNSHENNRRHGMIFVEVDNFESREIRNAAMARGISAEQFMREAAMREAAIACVHYDTNGLPI